MHSLPPLLPNSLRQLLHRWPEASREEVDDGGQLSLVSSQEDTCFLKCLANGADSERYLPWDWRIGHFAIEREGVLLGLAGFKNRGKGLFVRREVFPENVHPLGRGVSCIDDPSWKHIVVGLGWWKGGEGRGGDRVNPLPTNDGHGLR